jgi:hypothetical protein
MANLPTVQNPATGPRPAGRGETLGIRSGWPVFCLDDPTSVGKVHSLGGESTRKDLLVVSGGRWRRVVRRVPAEAVLSTAEGRVHLRFPRMVFLDLADYLPDQEVVVSVWESFRDFRPFRYPGTASVSVTCSEGVVTLSGHVAHEGHRVEAVRCAERADGVSGVRDLMISDEHLVSSVTRSFLPYPGLQPSLVRVSARLGTVELEGELASEELIGVASSLASGVAGVERLENRLRPAAWHSWNPAEEDHGAR